ncbi:hypothetical protein FACS189456_5530 [Bacteroidia bacterium]|nr:hypothetical protein FACS189456_5530 [Bacteroidia bacterium]
MLIFISGNLAAQNLNISGILLDSKNDPIVGATVMVKGTTIGTTTGINGDYNIAAAPDATLVFSFVGMDTHEEAVAGRGRIDVVMGQGSQEIDDVVVIGYGSIRKQDLSMAVTTVKLDQSLKSRPGAGVGTLLQGKVPGMTIQQDGGDPLRGQTITIRGKGSRDSDGVMWVVDGIPGAPYATEDIETVTVLKDAASAAIYGAQVGAGGVILITTKKAAAGKMKVEANVSYGVKNAWKLPQVVTAEQYMQKWQEVKDLAPTVKILGAAQDPLQYEYGTVTRTDWIDEIFRTGTLQHYAISISGGSETHKTLASFSYDKNEGILLNTYSKGLQAKLQTEFQPTKWFKFSERAVFGYSNGQGDVFNGSAQGVLMSANNWGVYGGGTMVNEYTVSWVIKFSDAAKWTGLLQTDPANSNDADVFVHGNEMGQSWSGTSATEGVVTNDVWHVLVISMKIGENGFGRYYCDGTYLKTNSGEPGNEVGRAHEVDGNSALDLATVLFLADNDGEDPDNTDGVPNTVEVSDIRIWDVALTDDDVQKLNVKLKHYAL